MFFYMCILKIAHSQEKTKERQSHQRLLKGINGFQRKMPLCLYVCLMLLWTQGFAGDMKKLQNTPK